jgi:hypothetical protein
MTKKNALIPPKPVSLIFTYLSRLYILGAQDTEGRALPYFYRSPFTCRTYVVCKSVNLSIPACERRTIKIRQSSSLGILCADCISSAHKIPREELCRIFIVLRSHAGIDRFTDLQTYRPENDKNTAKLFPRYLVRRGYTNEINM